MVLHFWFSGLLKAKICLQDCRWSQGTCSFQGILSSGCYSMIPTHFKNWRKWCAYCKYITPLNNVSFFLLSRKIAKKILFWIIQDISFGVKIQLFCILVLFANWSSLKFTLHYLGTLALEPFTLIGIIKT